jgi:RNA polymerase sigma-70 factor (ECF subfamily)
VCVSEAKERLLVAFPQAFQWLVTSQRIPPHDAQDAIQEALTAALDQLHRRLIREPEGWLRAAVIHSAIRAARRQRRNEPLNDSYAAESEDDTVASNEEIAHVIEAMLNLSESDREILALVYLGGLNYPEAADKLGIDRGTARRRHDKAMKNLRRLLGISEDLEK